jgi:hypothetical protein
MLDFGADPSASTAAGWSALLSAAANGFTGVATRLVELGADPNSLRCAGMFPLMLAAANGHDDCVRRIVELGGDVNLTADGLGHTVLMAAVVSCRFETIAYLLDRGADRRVVSFCNMSAMSYAQQFNRGDVANLLLSE